MRFIRFNDTSSFDAVYIHGVIRFKSLPTIHIQEFFLVIVLMFLLGSSHAQESFEGPYIYTGKEESIVGKVYIACNDTLDQRKKTMGHLSFDGRNYQIGIELHGSSTLLAPKKSYEIEFRKDSSEELSVPFLGLPQEEDFFLLANYYDSSFVRNALAFQLWENLGYYAPRFRFCELYVNGAYQGLYMGVEKIKVDSNRLNIGEANRKVGWKKHDPFLIRFDRNSSGDISGPSSLSNRGLKCDMLYPERDESRYREYDLESFINLVNISIAGNYNTTDVPFYQTTYNYEDYIDVQSFADYFVLNEMSKNRDAFLSSMYMHSKANRSESSLGLLDHGSLVMGPVWDFDLAFANDIDSAGNSVQAWTYKYLYRDVEEQNMVAWWHYLMCDDDFRNECMISIQRIRTALESSEEFLKDIRKTIEKDAIVDEMKWGQGDILHPKLQGPRLPNMESHHQAILNFCHQRLDWMETHLLNESCLSPFYLIHERNDYETFVCEPRNDAFLISFKNPLTSGVVGAGSRYSYYVHYTYKIFNDQGEEIASGGINGKSLSLDCKDWPKGTYFMAISDNAGTDLAISAVIMPSTFWRKLVKE